MREIALDKLGLGAAVVAGDMLVFTKIWSYALLPQPCQLRVKTLKWKTVYINKVFIALQNGKCCDAIT